MIFNLPISNDKDSSSTLNSTLERKTWDAANYIYWSVVCIVLMLFILDFFLLKELWDDTLYLKVAFIILSFISFTILRPLLKNPEWLMFGILALFSAYIFNVIHLTSGFFVTIYFILLTVVIGAGNFLALWRSKFGVLLFLYNTSIFFAFQYFDSFESLNDKLSLGGYAFFLVLIVTSFIPDARKRNYLVNILREEKKNVIIQSLNEELINSKLQLTELKQISKIHQEKEKLVLHDLKNKINNIIGLSDLIDDHGQQSHEETHSYNQLLKEVSIDLLKYANNIFSVDSLTSGSHLKIQIEAVMLHSCIKRTANELKLKLEAKNITLNIEESDLRTRVLADFLVFKNSLENILNYLINWSSDQSSITIKWFGHKGNIRIELAAPSAKIQPSELNRIFKPLENFENQTSISAPQGMGLQIARNMTEQMGGYFKYQSSTEKGVLFKLEFPEAL
ncbi:HAMP domain-containing histidine kinase [Belliella sp. DSM 107340]|uniref:histidine kinase n=1 Tax=Belliella calami TaxID=2923436 RepID=A0ABS9UNF5_9BACT|nr:HAMP domain-containing sensor histidine kinase [Belliella calami]MCH7398156.1 HAMP domain-containing histidine kinase [Belliella calami]